MLASNASGARAWVRSKRWMLFQGDEKMKGSVHSGPSVSSSENSMMLSSFLPVSLFVLSLLFSDTRFNLTSPYSRLQYLPTSVMPFTYWKVDDESTPAVSTKPPDAHADSSNQDADDAESSVPSLRDYQQKAVDAYQAARDQGIRRIGLSAPTGAGKTVVFAAIIHKVLKDSRRGKVLVLVNGEELADQAMGKIADQYDGNILIDHERNRKTAHPRSRV